MRTTILWVALLATAVAGSDRVAAQNVAAPTEPAAPAQSGPIATAQEQLKRDGFAPGPVNGVMTDATRRAIAAYQQRHGRPPDALAATGQQATGQQATGQPGGSADPVVRAQTGLRRLGLLAGPPDGTLGPQTRDAIIRFQAAHRLAIDPRVSDALLAALDEAAAAPAAASAAAPPAPAAASSAEPEPAAAGTAAAVPAALGRRPLPAWVNPPPIR